MKPKNGVIESFQNIPNEVLTKIAMYDWESLERLCIALTLDVQIHQESTKNKKKRDLES